MSEIDELRKQMAQAQVFGKGQYFEPGIYYLEVDKLFYQRTMVEGKTKESVIAEFKVLESTNPEIKVGETRSNVFSFEHAGVLGRIKALLIALAGHDPVGKYPPQVDELAANLYVLLRSPEARAQQNIQENFLKGKRVRAEGMAGLSRKGVKITNMKWTPDVQKAA